LAGRGVRASDRLGDVHAAVELVTVAAEHEERVVDPDAQADHDGEGGGEVRQVDDLSGDADDGHARADTEHRDADRQADGEHRTEGQQQDEDGAGDADGLRGGRLEVLEDLATEFDGQPVASGLLAQIEQVDGGGDLVRALLAFLDQQTSERRFPVLADLPLTVERSYDGDVLDRGRIGEERVDLGADPWVSYAEI